MKRGHKQGRHASNLIYQSPHNIILNFRINCTIWNTGIQEKLVMYSCVLFFVLYSTSLCIIIQCIDIWKKKPKATEVFCMYKWQRPQSHLSHTLTDEDTRGHTLVL